MPTTAHELNGNLIIDFGDGTNYTVHPVPGKVGIEIQAIMVGIAMGITAHNEGPLKAEADTQLVTKLALGIPTDESPKRRRKAPNRAEQAAQQRFTEFDQMRAARQRTIAQAAILWNVGGGGIEAVQDLLDEDGGYPKALGRVMESSGLGEQYKVLRTWLDGVAGTSETDSTKNPTGGPNTSV